MLIVSWDTTRMLFWSRLLISANNIIIITLIDMYLAIQVFVSHTISQYNTLVLLIVGDGITIDSVCLYALSLITWKMLNPFTWNFCTRYSVFQARSSLKMVVRIVIRILWCFCIFWCYRFMDFCLALYL